MPPLPSDHSTLYLPARTSPVPTTLVTCSRRKPRLSGCQSVGSIRQEEQGAPLAGLITPAHPGSLIVGVEPVIQERAAHMLVAVPPAACVAAARPVPVDRPRNVVGGI